MSGRHLQDWSFGRSQRLLTLAITVTLFVPTLAAAGGVRQGRGGFGASKPVAAVDEGLMFHVLNRITYGASPQDVAEIRTIGVDEFIKRQLNPADLDDTAVEAQLAAELPAYDDPLYGYQWNEFYYEHLLRARSSERQLQEVMVQFWENHFDTQVTRGNNDIERHEWMNLENIENQGFRENAFGYFKDLLTISAKSPSMSYFLDNWRNVVRSTNENYGREIMELHSMGVDCGYTQQDVEEVTRIFTGWSGLTGPGYVFPGADPGARDYVEEENRFLFRTEAHDYLAKTALGHDFPAGGGMEEGLELIDILAQHPCTARFISRKLLEVFVGDHPSEMLVDRIAGVFTQSQGHIKQVLQAIFDSPEFRDPVNFRNKVRTPIEFTIAAFRATDARVGSRPRDNALNREVYNYIRLQGMDLFDYDVPTGYYETADALLSWISSNGFLQRWRYGEALAFWYPGDGRYNWIDPMQTIRDEGLDGKGEAVVLHFANMILGPGIEQERLTRLTMALTDGTGTFDLAAGGQETRLREMIGQLLGSPEFTKQ